MPRDAALSSPQRWEARQPDPRQARSAHAPPLDVGPQFCVEPFEGIRAVRVVMNGDDWETAAADLVSGQLSLSFGLCHVAVERWSSTVFLGLQGNSPAGETVMAAQRPVSAVVATLDQPALPHSDTTWSLGLAPGLPRGRNLADMSAARSLLHWPQALLGLRWLGTDEFPPAARVTVGRTLNEAWIVDTRPLFEEGQIEFSLCWDETKIDPLGCTVAFRAEEDGMLLLSYQIKVSDLPGRRPDAAGRRDRPHAVGWDKRWLGVQIPRGPRRSDWSVSLFSADGRLLDDRPLAPRVEQISIVMSVEAGIPLSKGVIGDQGSVPTTAERADAVLAASEAIREARAEAARRRFSTAGELGEYLRWRFGCRAGELILLDPHLLPRDAWQDNLAFLQQLNRPVRALCRSVPQAVQKALANSPYIDVRALPNGLSNLHDRIWIVGETGLATGTSINGFNVTRPGRATTVTELPFADAAYWRQCFEQWWR